MADMFLQNHAGGSHICNILDQQIVINRYIVSLNKYSCR
jgi:hypothetical protein